MTLPAVEDFDDIARRLNELKPEPVKVEPETTEEFKIDWSFLSSGDGA